MASIEATANQIFLVIGLGTLIAGGITAGIGLFLSDRLTTYIQRVAKTIL